MKLKEIKTLEYRVGEEKEIQQILYHSKEPILIKIMDFPDKFSMDYFEKYARDDAKYFTYENSQCVSYLMDNFITVLNQIKENMPVKIFGQSLPDWQTKEIEQHVPLWKCFPARPRYFDKNLRVTYYFGGSGTFTDMHFDREHCSNLHLCFCGKKQILLFTEDQSEYLYKRPFVSDSLIDFAQPLEAIEQQFPKMNRAEGYSVLLEQGDMLFMPKNCWHYTYYIDASAAATYTFYTNKLLQFYGYLTGYFYFGHNDAFGYKANRSPLLEKFTRNYTHATGLKRFLYRLLESALYIVLFPVLTIYSLIMNKWIYPRKTY